MGEILSAVGRRTTAIAFILRKEKTMIDYGTSYFDALKRYVRLQKEYAAYRRKMRMRFVAMIAICCGVCVVHLIIFMFRLIFE